jgi:hypothetical protein
MTVGNYADARGPRSSDLNPSEDTELVGGTECVGIS